MPGTTRRVIVSRPLMLVSIIVSQSSGSPSYSGSSPKASPALFTSTSISCHSAGRLAILVWAFSRSLTSKASASTSVPLAVNSLLISARRCSFRPVRISLSPFSANLRAQASPMPLVAPVIKIVLLIMSAKVIINSELSRHLSQKCSEYPRNLDRSKL